MPAATDQRNLIADRLWTLFEAQATITAAVLPGNRDKGTEIGFLRKHMARANAPIDRARLEISFGRGRHSMYSQRLDFTKEDSTFTSSTAYTFDVNRTNEVVITYREPFPRDPGARPVQEAIEQTLFLAGPTLGITGVPPDGLGELVSDERDTRQGENPFPGRITTWRLPVTIVQSALTKISQTV
jgi:hypothetical protein